MLVLTGLFIVYFLLLIMFLAGWNKAMRPQKPAIKGKDAFISVVIPARNEELTIASLLSDLLRQEYKRFEVIVVNDHSDDETLWVVSRFEMENLHVVHNKGRGKKAAITTGVGQARGSVVVTTDADCSVTPRWLKEIDNAFQNPRIMMAFGGVRMKGKSSFFDSMQSLEFASLIGSGAATAAAGFPTLCNGANLAFRKKVFSAVKGYQGNLDIPSGDDEFLMRKVKDGYPDGVHFINSPEAVVTTRTEPGLGNFLHQRIRWASKWRYNSSLVAKILAVAVVVLQMAFIANWFVLFTPLILQSVFLIVIKVILEAAFLLQVSRFLGIRWNWLDFFALQIIYPPYVIGVSVASFFTPYRWKNRIFRPGRGSGY